jgi:hypothetical protein
MNLMRLDWFSRIAGNRVEWFSTLGACDKRVQRLVESEPYYVSHAVEAVEIPLRRRQLLDWLNDNLRSANS